VMSTQIGRGSAGRRITSSSRRSCTQEILATAKILRTLAPMGCRGAAQMGSACRWDTTGTALKAPIASLTSIATWGSAPTSRKSESPASIEMSVADKLRASLTTPGLSQVFVQNT